MNQRFISDEIFFIGVSMKSIKRCCALLFVFLTIVRAENATSSDECQCDLTASICDASCCCDSDCSNDDLQNWNCQEKPTVVLQSTCFKDLPIYRSNSPYGFERKDDQICVAHPRVSNVEDSSGETLFNRTWPTTSTGRTINANSSSSLPSSVPLVFGQYQVGSTIFKQTSTIPYKFTIYSLPVASFGSSFCSKYQPITFMNDFTSTCTQTVTTDTCRQSLSTIPYQNLCFARTPAGLLQNQTGLCCTSTIAATQITATSCTDVIASLTLFIYYSNPDGITGCTATITPGTATLGGTFKQTFNVKFFSNNASSTKQIRSGNPGYLTKAPILAGTLSGGVATQVPFTILQPSATGLCSDVSQTLVRFGQNYQSFCRFSSTNTPPCLTVADVQRIFTSNIASDLYVGIYGNSDLSNSNGRVQVIRCLSEIGSSDRPVCEDGTFPSISSGQCYVRLDIQIGFANTGSVTNPQRIIGTVVFHYQRLSSTATSTLSTPVVISQTVTFQDLSNSPVTANGQISRPNTRILGDFFYPFSLSRASPSFSFPLFSFLLFLLLS